MRQDDLIARVADELGLTIVEPLAGGQFGAVRVEGDRVLKAFPWLPLEAMWARGAAMCERLRADGYPAPRYDGVGATDEAVWSLQQLLPGAVPDPASSAHVEQMVELALRHRDAASDEPEPPLAAILEAMQQAVGKIADHEVGRELAALLERSADVVLRAGDITHGDFHTFNVLADGDRLTGVFDWEGAMVGDWRNDLANIVVTTDHTVAGDALREHAPPDVAALLVGWHCARYLAFDADVRPHVLPEMAAKVSERLGGWWR